MHGYDPRMTSLTWQQRAGHVGMAPVRWAAGWGRILYFASTLLVLAMSRSSYGPRTRAALMRHVYTDTAPILAGFTALSALLTLVITRIVIVSAQSYGLSRYALEMVIRVLVLELIPLTAALLVALRCTIPGGAALAIMRHSGDFDAARARGEEPLTTRVLPRALAGIYATITLAALSCSVALVLAYLAVYGATLAGIPAYTRVFGRVFNPQVSLIFLLKTIFFSFAVSFIPIASALQDTAPADGSRESAALRGLVRMFAVLLVLEAASLAVNYT
jgi:phospholipid/cholesterol/gamma-HCH transport system permease protein